MAVAGLTSKILYQGGSSNVLFTDRREFYPEEEVFEYWKNQTQFLTWLNRLSREKTPDPLFKIFEDSPTYVNQYMYNNAATITIAANGAESSAIAVDNITGLTQDAAIDDSIVGLLFEIWSSDGKEYRGNAFVSDASSTTEVLMKTTEATAIDTVNNDIFRCIGTVRGERSVAAEAYFNELTVVWNSTHYFSLPIEVTGKLYKASKLKGYDDELGRLRVKKFKEAKYQVQNALMKSTSVIGTNLDAGGTFNEDSFRSITDQDGESSTVRTTYGYASALRDFGTTWTGGTMSTTTNIFRIAAASFDFDTAVDIFQVIFDKRETATIAGFCGYGFLGSIAKAVMGDNFKFSGQFQIGDAKINGLGFDIRNLTTPFGTVQLVPMKSLDNEYKNFCLLPNDQAIGIREFEPWEYLTNIKTDNNYNGVKDVINYDAGMQLTLLPTHHIIDLT